MAFDSTLTREIALQRIGDPWAYHPPYDDPECNDPNVTFEHRNGYYDATWVFGEHSFQVQSLRELRESQKTFGYSSEETLEAHKKLSFSKTKSGLGSFCSGYSDERRCWSIFYEDAGTAIDEALINAIEHGSEYCSRGPVKVHFLGGKNGAIFEVDDPGSGSIKLPLTTEELLV